MSVFSTITGYLADVFNGGSSTVAIHQSIEGGKPQTSMSGFAPGLEINPADGENIVITKIKGSNSFVVSVGGTNQNIEPSTARGERKLYSVSEDGLELKASLHLKNDGSTVLSNDVSEVALDLDGNFGVSNENGSISLDSDGVISNVNVGGSNVLGDDGIHVFNGGTDNAVRYSALETAYNQLKTDFDTLVTTFNAHVHVVTTPDTINGTAAPTVTPGATSTGDITSSKVDDIQLP